MRMQFRKAILSYANPLKQNTDDNKQPTYNTTDQASERPTLKQQTKSFNAKHGRRNRLRSISNNKHKRSTKGSRNCKTEKGS